MVRNIGIVGKDPTPNLYEMVHCDFSKNCPHTDPEANFICCTSDRMTPRDFLKFLLINHIGVVVVSSDFSFDCSGESYEADTFKAAIEKIFDVIWQCQSQEKSKRKSK